MTRYDMIEIETIHAQAKEIAGRLGIEEATAISLILIREIRLSRSVASTAARTADIVARGNRSY